VTSRYYNVNELNTLSAAYPDVEVLSINLVDIRDDIDDTAVLQDFVITAENEASTAQIELKLTLVCRPYERASVVTNRCAGSHSQIQEATHCSNYQLPAHGV